MNETTAKTRRQSGMTWIPLEQRQRLSLLFVPTGFVAVFLVSLWLSPSPSGLGTHRQLGLPPCTMQSVFHVPCPTCGMTTAFSHMARGHIVAAFLCQPAGAGLFAAGAIGALAVLVVAALGRRPTGLDGCLRSKALWGGVVVLILASWVYKIVLAFA